MPSGGPISAAPVSPAVNTIEDLNGCPASARRWCRGWGIADDVDNMQAVSVVFEGRDVVEGLEPARLARGLVVGEEAQFLA